MLRGGDVLVGAVWVSLVTSMLRPAHREALAAGGAAWLDRRGEVRVPSLGIDADVAPMLAPPPARADVWERRGVIAVALALLQQGGPVPVTWDLGFYASLTGGGASLALQALRSLDLIDEHDHPRRQSMFAQLMARWHTCWFPLAQLPTEAALTDGDARLLIAGRDDLRQPGWAVMPHSPTLDADGDGHRAPRLLVADQRALAWLLRVWGPATTGDAAALVAAAPSPVAVAQRQPPAAGSARPRVHPVTAALEQATPGGTAESTDVLPLPASQSGLHTSG